MIHPFRIIIHVSRQKLSAALQIWSTLTPHSISSRDTTQGTETARRHALESHARNLQSVQAMEKTMDIPSRWMPECAEWVAAAEKTKMRRYQRCIDTLEGLVVSRMFELTKMNMSQTGKLFLGGRYKLIPFLCRLQSSETYRQRPQVSLDCYSYCPHQIQCRCHRSHPTSSCS